MSAQRWPLGQPWKAWAQQAWPGGWLVLGGRRDGETHEAGLPRWTQMLAGEVPLKAHWWTRDMPPDDASVTVQTEVYVHHRIAFPPDLTMHVYAEQDLSIDEVQRRLFARLLANQPGVEDVRDVLRQRRG